MRQLLSICGRYAAGRDGNGVGVCRLAVVVLIAVIIMMTLSACGGGGASGNPQPSAGLSGNWQFTMAPQTDGNSSDPTFSGGLQGGFLLQNGSSITGQLVYGITSSASATGVCNGGSAPATAMLSGQKVTITETAGTQGYTLTGTLSSDGSTMMGTYTTTAGTAADGSPCGYAETGLSWSAVSVSAVTGTVQGFFHSTASVPIANQLPLTNQDFVVSGSLTQGPNIGASNATVTGTLSFIDLATSLSDYPCFSSASVNGQISGNTVVLQIIGTNGAAAGQIGGTVTNSGMSPATVNSTPNGYVLQGGIAGVPGYAVDTKACPGTGLGLGTEAGDFGNICLALNDTTGCQQPIILSPASVIFPSQLLGGAATAQTITLTNNSGSAASGLMLNFQNEGDNTFGGQSDFDLLPSFTETDACGAGGAASNGQPFDLTAGQSCSITVTFSTEESSPWFPFIPMGLTALSIAGVPPEYCPFPQSAQITATVNSPPSADNDASFSVPITGIGLSALQPSTPELDFGAENALNPQESSLPQSLTFTNYSGNPVQILDSAPCVNPTFHGRVESNTLPRPLNLGSAVAGLQVVANYNPLPFIGIAADMTSITYGCDSDPVSKLPNFVISSDTCSGTNLASQQSCTLQVSYTPQAATYTANGNGLDAYLELNTVQCSSMLFPTGASSDCEIDSGRFPVELKANAPSPLRMSPSAGLDFGYQKHGTTSTPMTVTLLNDPNLANAQPVTFIGRISVSGNYSELDDCPATLAPGSSCTLSVTFSPAGTGFATGILTIDYSPEPTSEPQVVYLRGTGQ
jgi:hypothetical protein